MPDGPNAAQLLGDAQEVATSLERLEKRALAAAEAASLEPAHPWSGRPRAAAAFRDVAAEARRCATLAASVGLRDPDSDGWSWIQAATNLRRAADAQERMAWSMAGWGWRKPAIVGALRGALWATLAGILLTGMALLLKLDA